MEETPGWPAPYSDGATNPWIGQLLMGLPMALAVLSASGSIMIGNDAMRATMGDGYRTGARPEWLVVPDDADKVAQAVAASIRNNERVEVRAALLDRPEEKQVIAIMPVPPGLGVAALLALPDIREQLRLEAQVAAVTRMQAVGQLAGGIAHDFNNILTAVLGIADQLIERHPHGDPDHEYLAEIRRNGQRAAALVEQLLAFARQQPQRQQVLDLVPLLDGLRPLLMQLLGKAIDLQINAPPLAAAVMADPGQIEQVIVNLAVNARDAMSGAGMLRIEARLVAASDIAAQGHRIIPLVDHIAIDVIDTGTGIAPAIAGKIFEPFFTTKPIGQGTGLGLSTVYGIVKQTGGYIFAQPALAATGSALATTGYGTKFSLFLPAVPMPAVVAPAPQPAAPPNPDSIAGLNLLLVEDEATVRLILERGLRRFGPFVTLAENAAIALDCLASDSSIDVIISDIMMPGLDGVELAARARRLRPGIGIVLMSGFAEAPLYRAADAQGIRFLSKPFALAELVAAIAAANAERSVVQPDFTT